MANTFGGNDSSSLLSNVTAAGKEYTRALRDMGTVGYTFADNFNKLKKQWVKEDYYSGQKERQDKEDAYRDSEREKKKYLEAIDLRANKAMLDNTTLYLDDKTVNKLEEKVNTLYNNRLENLDIKIKNLFNQRQAKVQKLKKRGLVNEFGELNDKATATEVNELKDYRSRMRNLASRQDALNVRYGIDKLVNRFNENITLRQSPETQLVIMEQALKHDPELLKSKVFTENLSKARNNRETAKRAMQEELSKYKLAGLALNPMDGVSAQEGKYTYGDILRNKIIASVSDKTSAAGVSKLKTYLDNIQKKLGGTEAQLTRVADDFVKTFGKNESEFENLKEVQNKIINSADIVYRPRLIEEWKTKDPNTTGGMSAQNIKVYNANAAKKAQIDARVKELTEKLSNFDKDKFIQNRYSKALGTYASPVTTTTPKPKQQVVTHKVVKEATKKPIPLPPNIKNFPKDLQESTATTGKKTTEYDILKNIDTVLNDTFEGDYDKQNRNNYEYMRDLALDNENKFIEMYNGMTPKQQDYIKYLAARDGSSSHLTEAIKGITDTLSTVSDKFIVNTNKLADTFKNDPVAEITTGIGAINLMRQLIKSDAFDERDVKNISKEAKDTVDKGKVAETAKKTSSKLKSVLSKLNPKTLTKNTLRAAVKSVGNTPVGKIVQALLLADNGLATVRRLAQSKYDNKKITSYTEDFIRGLADMDVSENQINISEYERAQRGDAAIDRLLKRIAESSKK
jgi:hypothetical protein